METTNENPAEISLPSDREILIVRRFRAPKALLFDVWTKAAHLLRWFVCPGMTMSDCEVDLRVGGKWRFVIRDGSGAEHTLSGEYQEISEPNRLVFIERYEPIPGSDHLVTLTFDERDGRTTLTQCILHASKEARDGHLGSGMANGVQAAFERMEAVLSDMARAA